MFVSPHELRCRILTDEFDYRTIMSALGDYSSPRDRITRLLAQGVILQIRRGLYVFTEPFARHPLSRELLANLIHGPSYLSMESALEYHSMIPERVRAVTSASLGRTRRFDTGAGSFIYRRVPGRVFATGTAKAEISGGRSFLVATPEKALADMIHVEHGLDLRSLRALEEYLYEDLRIDPATLETMDSNLMRAIATAYGTRRTGRLAEYIERINSGEEASA